MTQATTMTPAPAPAQAQAQAATMTPDPHRHPHQNAVSPGARTPVASAAWTPVADLRHPGSRRRPRRFLALRQRIPAGGDDLGMATAEYAIATVAAAGFAGLLMVILRGAEVKALLLGIIRGALSV